MMLVDAGATPAMEREAMAAERVDAVPFADVYEAHADAVYRFCLAQLGDPAAAEDVTAQAFVNAYAAYDRVEPDAQGVRPWIFRIARNAAVDHRRRARWRDLLVGRLGSFGAAGGASDVDVETAAGLREELRRALRVVGGLGRRDRELVGLRVAGGLSFAEIAELMGMSEQAARTATHRALVRVRAALEEAR